MNTLPNGAEIVAIDFERQIVLAYNEGAYLPYVTWEFDEEMNCYCGNYFESRKDAREDFTNR